MKTERPTPTSPAPDASHVEKPSDIEGVASEPFVELEQQSTVVSDDVVTVKAWIVVFVSYGRCFYLCLYAHDPLLRHRYL